jgi:hypothetical protein
MVVEGCERKNWIGEKFFFPQRKFWIGAIVAPALDSRRKIPILPPLMFDDSAGISKHFFLIF